MAYEPKKRFIVRVKRSMMNDYMFLTTDPLRTDAFCCSDKTASVFWNKYNAEEAISSFCKDLEEERSEMRFFVTDILSYTNYEFIQSTPEFEYVLKAWVSNPEKDDKIVYFARNISMAGGSILTASFRSEATFVKKSKLNKTKAEFVDHLNKQGYYVELVKEDAADNMFVRECGGGTTI